MCIVFDIFGKFRDYLVYCFDMIFIVNSDLNLNRILLIINIFIDC